jgi:ribosomal RNA-processing protein 12
LQHVLQAVLPQLDARHDVDTLTRLIFFCEEALRVLAQRGAATGIAPHIGAVFARVAPLVAATSDGVRRAAADALVAALRRCVTRDMVEAAVVDAEAAAQRGAPAGLPRAVVAVTALLGAGYQDAWPMAVPVVSELFTALGRPGAPMTHHTLRALAAMCRGSADAVEYSSLASRAMGVAIAALGPRAVLAVVPLEVTDLATCDTWLVPLLRKHVSGAEMGFWAEQLLPKAVTIGTLAARARQAGESSSHLLGPCLSNALGRFVP